MDRNTGGAELLELGLLVQGDKIFQERLLAGVSLTYASAAPVLPPNLRLAAVNAFLLSQAAETIDAYVDADVPVKQELFRRLSAAASDFSQAGTAALPPSLLAKLPPAGRELLRNLPRLLRVTACLPPLQRQAVRHCVEQACAGYIRLLPLRGPDGVPDLRAYDDYGYCRNGALSQCLTTLFCDHSPAIARHTAELHALASDFGRGLCATQILKNVRRDRQRGVCYLPRDLFRAHGLELADHQDWSSDPRFRAGFDALIGRAHAQLRKALDYVLLLPPDEDGIRRFCIWPVGLALMTLRRLHGGRRRPALIEDDLRMRPRALRLAVPASRWLVRRDPWLRGAFRLASRGLPAPTGGR